ncbi:MAG: hypothetical protein DMD61_05355 [Gemmatimonadetes bacterium]|nr:MAG: hypothetical protein DMD61_05355 [Gemmatimonadota bacterium]
MGSRSADRGPARRLPSFLRRLRHRRDGSALVSPRSARRAARSGYPVVPGRPGLSRGSGAAAGAGAPDRGAHVPLRVGAPAAVQASEARGLTGGLPRAARSAPPARAPAALRVRLGRTAHRSPPVRVPQLCRGMTPRPFTGLRVLLVAAFNRRYHRSALSLASALKSLGCEVQRCEERWRGVNRILRRPLAGRLAARLRRAPVDVVLVFKVARLAPQDVRDIKACFRARWANWFPDDPHLLETSLRLGPAYDCFFTHDSSSLERHRAAGARAHYLAFGCDPEYLRPLPASPRWATALAFVGSRDPAREEALSGLGDLGLTIWGPGWPRGPVYGEDFVRVLSSAVVGLNMHQQFGERGDPARYGTGANMRVFELAAVGTPQLSDAKADIARHFAPDREILLYHNVAELKERARALLADEPWRRGLAAAARERALREHTWRHRLEELLTVTLR